MNTWLQAGTRGLARLRFCLSCMGPKSLEGERGFGEGFGCERGRVLSRPNQAEDLESVTSRRW